ncbi:hypothetical protein L6452_04176 [Arctium lappa]|uniref:Uncharacterized protein n=1 Tax=Arctium lappa TaxID=4217 RepID=A0ACB9FPC9_ARCLA|nr:hypothetical protein L6452_04176 [Arctium lappa]
MELTVHFWRKFAKPADSSSDHRSDWESRYHFWRDLIIKIARHLHIFIILPSVVKNVWVNQEGLTPLCLDHVLVTILWPTHPDIPQSKTYALLSKSPIPSKDDFIVSTLLEEKFMEVVKLLCDDHWTSSCIVTMRKFQVICGGAKEASVILIHLSKCGKTKYLAIRHKDLIEESISLFAVPSYPLN